MFQSQNLQPWNTEYYYPSPTQGSNIDRLYHGFSWRVGKAVRNIRNYTVCMGIGWQITFSKIEFYAIYESRRKITQAGVKRCTSHEPNGMQMRKTLCSPLFAFDSAHVKYGVWPGPKSKKKEKLSFTYRFILCSKSFATLCGGFCHTVLLGANCRHAVRNRLLENSRIHRCSQNRISDKPSRLLLFSNNVWVL